MYTSLTWHHCTQSSSLFLFLFEFTQYAGNCKMCDRPYTVFKWRPGRGEGMRQTQVCQTCSKIKNLCQTCILDLQFGMCCIALYLLWLWSLSLVHMVHMHRARLLLDYSCHSSSVCNAIDFHYWRQVCPLSCATPCWARWLKELKELSAACCPDHQNPSSFYCPLYFTFYMTHTHHLTRTTSSRGKPGARYYHTTPMHKYTHTYTDTPT